MNKIDPICGMKGTIPAHGHYFCSQGCIEKYEKEHNIPHETCTSCSVPAKKWYQERLYVVVLVVIILVTLSFFIPLLQPFFNAFIDYLELIWWAILLGFLIGGFIDYFVPRKYIEKYLSRHRKRTIIYSIIFGFLMSACSHGILAIAIELYKKGANTSSVIAFLLASPWANLPITILLFGFFGTKAALIVVSALIIATITGLIYQRLEQRGMVECAQCFLGEDTPVLTDFSIIKDIKKRWNVYKFTAKNNMAAVKGIARGSWSLSKMVLWWLLIGMLMAAFARAYIPHHLFEQYMGPTLLGLLVTLLFATIIEVCSEGSSPLAFEIYDKTLKAGTPAFGNSFTFLMAGVATDYTEIGLIWSNIGKKAALWLPIITVPQILILGFLFNALL
ncbi:MAG: permease [Thermoplasmatales archaeon]|nr:MAG: permease [Thermoplasmatales archaeon]